jgi:hypothetical protein
MAAVSAREMELAGARKPPLPMTPFSTAHSTASSAQSETLAESPKPLRSVSAPSTSSPLRAAKFASMQANSSRVTLSSGRKVPSP